MTHDEYHAKDLNFADLPTLVGAIGAIITAAIGSLILGAVIGLFVFCVVVVVGFIALTVIAARTDKSGRWSWRRFRFVEPVIVYRRKRRRRES